MTYTEMACRMLDVFDLPSVLQSMLDRANERIQSVNGTGLVSRQAVAAIISAWEMTK